MSGRHRVSTRFALLPQAANVFGAAGPHLRPGAHLARRESSAILIELLARVPDIHAAGPPDRLLSSFINGIRHLPCDFTA